MIQQHDWDELSKICHDAQERWKEAVGRQARSGMHDNNFCSFCRGFKGAHHLHKWSEIKLKLMDSATATLPPNYAVGSNEDCAADFVQTQAPSSAVSKHLKKAKTEETLIAIVDKLKAIGDPGLSQVKQDLHRLEAECGAKDKAREGREMALKEKNVALNEATKKEEMAMKKRMWH